MLHSIGNLRKFVAYRPVKIRHSYMIPEYQYLNLSLRYAHGGKSTTVFSFPSSIKASKSPFDATSIISRFINLSEFYVTGCHDGRRFFSFVSVDDADNSGARLELTISLDSDVLLPGRTVLNLINSIKEMLEHDEPFNDDTLTKALSTSGFPETPLRSDARPQGNTIEGSPCYRTYISSTELGNIMSFPRQAAYAPYSEVALVHVTSAPVPDEPLPQITEPVTQAFTVVCPSDVTPSAESVEITDHLALTYTRAGFEPATVSFEVGTTNRYVRITGPALTVNSAEKAGIIFTQRIAYNVISSKGNAVKAYTILINGRTATRADGSFEVSSTDFNADGKVNISVSSTNYFTTSVDMTSEQLLANQPLELILVPEELPIVLRMDFGQGRTMEQEILLEKSSQEYCQLRAGRFHGFRAHRLMGHEPESYNIDLTTAAAPRQEIRKDTPAQQPDQVAQPTQQPAVAPETPAVEEKNVEEPASQTTQQPTAVVERPKSAAEIRAEQLRRDIPVKNEQEKSDADSKTVERKKHLPYADDRPKKIDILQDDPDDEESSSRSLSPIIIAVVAVAIITIGIVWYLFNLLPSDTAEEQLDEQTSSDTRINIVNDESELTHPLSDSVANTTEAAAPTVATTLTPEEQADIEYLNANKVWNLEKLKSPKYRDFFTSLGEGNIDKIANSDYFAVTGQATNKQALEVVDMIWKAKGTHTERTNVRILEKLKDKESIDVYKLYEDLSRAKDKDPNTTPRPQR